VRWESLTPEIGTPAPQFRLPGIDGKHYALADVAGEKGLLVAFICNHCPFVLHIIDEFARIAEYAGEMGLGVVAISSNDVEAFPEDDPEHMAAFAARHGFTFPYLYDESQEAALAFRAVCTPDIFLYDRDLALAYAGQFDDSRPKTPHSQGSRTEIPVTGKDLRAAIEKVAAGQPVPLPHKPSNGCSMKWKEGNEPEWG
jgi:peroxiredoxin